MAAPDPLLELEAYYDYRGTVGVDEDAPPLWLPHNQGDVFRGIELPGIEQDDNQFAMLFQHPCTMRAGAVLKTHVVMLSVSKVSNSLRSDPAYWSNRFSSAPLPGLLLGDDRSFAGDFLRVATVPSDKLDRATRISALSADGRLQFQQRVIFYLTRFLPSVEELAEATNAVEAEVSLQGSWVERAVAALDGQAAIEEVIAQAEHDFDAYMKEDDRRIGLRDLADQHRINAEVHREIDERYPTA